MFDVRKHFFQDSKTSVFHSKQKEKTGFWFQSDEGNFRRLELVAPVQFMLVFPNGIECHKMQFPASLLERWTLKGQFSDKHHDIGSIAIHFSI